VVRLSKTENALIRSLQQDRLLAGTRGTIDEYPRHRAARHSRDQVAAKSEAEKLRSGYSHAEDAQVSKLFVTDPQTREIDWIATKNARLAMLERFANRRSTRFLAS
jgi:hypothetical protein